MTTPQANLVLDALHQPDEQPDLQHSPQRWGLLALLFTAMLISYAHRGALSVAVATSTMSEDLQLTEASIGVLLSAFFCIYSFMQMPSGWLVDRFGVERAYALGFAFWSVISGLTGFANGFATLVGLRIALGAGEGVSVSVPCRAGGGGF